MPDATHHGAMTSKFAELVCADPAWLRAEFDAIMSANFGVVPPRSLRPRPGSAGPQQHLNRPSPAAVPGGRLVKVAPPADDTRRERSPPPAVTSWVSSHGR